jgi:hypothetical protein
MSDRSILNHEQLSTLLILTTRRSAPSNPRSTRRAGMDLYLAIVGAGAPVSLIALDVTTVVAG